MKLSQHSKHFLIRETFLLMVYKNFQKESIAYTNTIQKQFLIMGKHSPLARTNIDTIALLGIQSLS
jgi:hypothetical protein